MTEEKQTVSNETEVQNFDDVELLKRLRRIRIANIWTVRIFFTVFFAVAVIALIIPLRPTYSEAEKRELTKFPKFTLSALFSGEYFIDVDKWYSDTFPARDSFTDFNTRVTMLFGKKDVQIHGEVEEGDAIPSVEENTEDEQSSEESTASGEGGSEESQSSDYTVTSEDAVSSAVSNKNEVNTSTSVQSAASSAVEQSVSSVASSVNQASSVPSSSAAVPSTPPAPTTQTMGALLINGDTAYEYYNFSKSAADIYTNAINRAGELLNGKAQVYDLIVPTSMGITAPEKLVASVNTSNQKAAIDYMHSRFTALVKYVPLYDMLKSHSSEYIYFRTDHHWTALAAYYSYCELFKSMGKNPMPIESFIKHEYKGFLGSFYSSSGKLPQLAVNPDTVYAYQPPSTNAIRILSKEGKWFDSNIISDMNATSSSNKYLTFIKGDNAQSVIINPALNDTSVCVVIKESFGNAFVPFLVPHYQYLYVIDYRYFAKVDTRGLVKFCEDARANDVIFINNISATRNKTLMGYIDAFVR